MKTKKKTKKKTGKVLLARLGPMNSDFETQIYGAPKKHGIYYDNAVLRANIACLERRSNKLLSETSVLRQHVANKKGKIARNQAAGLGAIIDEYTAALRLVSAALEEGFPVDTRTGETT